MLTSFFSQNSTEQTLEIKQPKMKSWISVVFYHTLLCSK